MTAKLIILAAGMAIPFGSPQVEAPRPHALAELSLSFEFAETDLGFDLNAIVEDHTADEVHRIAVDSCGAIDIDSFDEDLFGTPAICDGRRYVFDLVGNRLVVLGGEEEQELMTVEATHVVLNGVPMMVAETPFPETSLTAQTPHGLR